MKNQTNITNIAFEGGGVLGIAYGGALEVLEKEKVMDNITNVAGTSAGSIVALIVALKYNSSEMKDILFSLEYNKFEEGPNYLRLLTKYGYYKTDYALNFIENLIKTKFGNADVTFKDLKKNNNPNLYVFATCLSTNSVQEFSYEKTPDTPLSQAVLASMSIPFFFEALNIDNKIYVDGGITFNYPILHFDSIDSSFQKTLGLAFAQSTDSPENSTKIDAFGYDHFGKFVKHCFVSLQNAQSSVWLEDTKIKNATILIETNDIKSTDFNLSDDQKNMLYNNGKIAASNYLKNSFSMNYLQELHNI